ncbi:hypothetical protein AB6N24_09930 [Cellulomonas sp. 179-A 4D5 NHS]|uniref:hypothetical protein n=1 Tax=Cellulomonas sp. 179-A 4D5 NHS TaxID=3142378 RepID=UPI0039A350A6
MTRAPAGPAERHLHVPPWRELGRAGQVMAGAYLRAGAGARLGAGARAVLTPLVGLGFSLLLAVYRPFVRYWRDPHDARRLITVTITPRGHTVVPVLRMLAGLAVLAAALLLPLAMPTRTLGLGLLSVLVLTAVLAAVSALAALVLLALPYPGMIRSAGPQVPGTDLTVSLAASTAPGGMREVRAYLMEHHGGQRVTVRARDERARRVYALLGLEVVRPGFGRMTGIIPEPRGASWCTAAVLPLVTQRLAPPQREGAASEPQDEVEAGS